MKGQISFVEFLTAMLIFIGFVAYLSIQVLNFIPSYLAELKAERLRIEAFQISELLLNDPGHPINWNERNVVRIGLSDERMNKTNLLSSYKIGNLSNMCSSSYSLVKQKLGSEVDFSILITDLKTGQVKVNCRPVEGRGVFNVTVRRVAAYENGFLEVVVQVW